MSEVEAQFYDLRAAFRHFRAENPGLPPEGAAAMLDAMYGSRMAFELIRDTEKLGQGDLDQEHWEYFQNMAKAFHELVPEPPAEYGGPGLEQREIDHILTEPEAYEADSEAIETDGGVFGAHGSEAPRFTVRFDGVSLRARNRELRLTWTDVITLLCGAVPSFSQSTEVSVRDHGFRFVVCLDYETKQQAAFRVARKELLDAINDTEEFRVSGSDHSLNIENTNHVTPGSSLEEELTLAEAAAGIGVIDGKRPPVMEPFPHLEIRERLGLPIDDEAWARVQRRHVMLASTYSEKRFLMQFESPKA